MHAYTAIDLTPSVIRGFGDLLNSAKSVNCTALFGYQTIISVGSTFGEQVNGSSLRQSRVCVALLILVVNQLNQESKEYGSNNENVVHHPFNIE